MDPLSNLYQEETTAVMSNIMPQGKGRYKYLSLTYYILFINSDVTMRTSVNAHLAGICISSRLADSNHTCLMKHLTASGIQKILKIPKHLSDQCEERISISSLK